MLTEVGIFLARERPRIVKTELQNWFAIRSIISWLLESTKVQGNLLGCLVRLII